MKKYIPYSIFLIVFLIGMILFKGVWNISNKNETLKNIGEGKESQIILDNIHHVEIHNGVKEWIFYAKKAVYFQSQKQTYLHDITGMFYRQKDKGIDFQANSGVINSTGLVVLDGNISLKTDSYRIKTEKLNYDPRNKTLQSMTPVTLSGSLIDVYGDKFLFDLSTGDIMLENKISCNASL